MKRLNISLADHFLTSMILSFYDLNGLNFIPVSHHNLISSIDSVTIVLAFFNFLYRNSELCCKSSFLYG